MVRATTTSAKAASVAPPTCVLDTTVVNEGTISEMTNLGLSFFATLCGMNRGAFVLEHTDRHTWGCTSFPPNFPALAGVDTDIVLKDANAIKETFEMKNVTASDTVKFLDYFVKVVYHSTPNKATDPYACNVGGLGTLQCPPVNALKTLRSVTLAGLFTPALWATGGRELTIEEADSFYGPKDFKQMSALGLNTVQIPVPVSAFDPTIDDVDDVKARLASIIGMADDYELKVILLLEGEDNDNAVTAAAHYAAKYPSVFALTVTSKLTVRAARAAESDLTLMVPITQRDLQNLDVPDDNVYASLDLSHTTCVADVASSTSLDDRMKLFYHESKACIWRSPLEYTACYHRVPVFVRSGFDLSIDDCVHKGISKYEKDIHFVNYGQCDRLDETIDSHWWKRHRASFAARHLFSYEHGLGWSFTAWKLFDEANVGVIDSFEKLLSLKDISDAGLFPDLDDEIPAQYACLNGPADDFVMGDETFSPTIGPHSECAPYGW